ncbi:MAG: Thiol:disulfide interchange protein DsbD [Phycisphaerae bacterium]|nr:Thiol:disulfide interchange protein DsbD [Phycisphaerae bacterium]
MRPHLSLIILVVSASLAQAEAPFSDLKYDEALAKAKTENKFVVLDFWATWCGYCKQLDEQTWPDSGVKEWIEKNAIAIKIDADVEKDLAVKFSVQGLPTVVFLKSDGSEAGRFEGFHDPAGFMEKASAVVSGQPGSPTGQQDPGSDFGPSPSAPPSAPTPSQAPAQTVMASLSEVNQLADESWWWKWGAMIIMTGLVLGICFKNPKRQHDN